MPSAWVGNNMNMKNLILTLSLLVCSLANGQILKTTNLHLNPGGTVYDVAYDGSHEVYVIVGDFTTVNGVARNNFAVIDANTFNLLGSNPISNIDGVIRSVELVKSYKYFYAPSGIDYVDTLYSIYIGGNFQTINGQNKSYLARISSLWTGQSASASPFALDNFNLFIDPVVSPTMDDGIFDMTTDLAINNQNTQSVSLVGNFTVSTGAGAPFYASYNDNEDLYNFARFRHVLVNNQSININREISLSSSITTAFSPTFYDISYTYEGLMLSENTPTTAVHAKVYALGSANDQGSILREYSNANNMNASGREATVRIKPNGDTTLLATRFTDNTAEHASLDQNAAAIDNFSIRDLVPYNGDVYNTLPDVPNSLASLGKTTYGTLVIAATNLALFNDTVFQKKLHGAKDHLFLSDAGLTSVNGNARSGLAIFCLEPYDSKPFTSVQASVCHDEIHTYTIDAVKYADGYRWTYSGSGALYRITSSGNPWLPLSTLHLSQSDAHSIDIQFPTGSTSGTLSVAPYSVCNTSSDYQYSLAQTTAINVNTLPDITLSPSYTLNCYSDSALIVAQSSMPNVDFSWTYPTSSFATLNDTIIVTQGSNFSDSSYYVVEVTNPISGCFSVDSTYFATDLVATSIDQSAITTNPLEWTCLTDSMTINSNIIGATVTWKNPPQAGTFPDPYVITSLPNGDLTVFATYLSNGCSTQADWGGIIENQVVAEPVLVGHPNFDNTPTDDSLSCANPILNLQCGVTAPFAANSTANWINSGNDLLNLTVADSAGMNPVFNFKTYKFVTTNTSSGCTDTSEIVVRFDLDKPYVFQLGDDSFNCSQSEINLTHPTNGSPSVIEGWLDGTGAQTGSNTLLTTSIGDYYYEVLDTENGCTNTDTVSITQTLDLLLDMPSDTLICPDEIVSITPSVIGNTETPSYLWSTGSNSTSESATGGIDSLLFVTVTTPSGCVGTDTTMISITAPVDATITQFAGCTYGSLEVTSISGGAGNYQYALDGSTWQTSTNFSGLAFGNYTVSVQDSLGCVYDFDQVLDGTALSIEVNFVASTYNEEGDTIVLVNVTDFTGLDSIAWGLPANANVFYEDDSTVILSMDTSGWYDVDLYGYLGANCVYTKTKSVYFGTEAPVFDSAYAVNGIQDIDVYPSPTDDMFTVDIEFGKAQNYSIVITNSLGQPIGGMNVSSTGTIVSHAFQFPIGTPAGSYRIHIIADYDATQKMVILN